MLQETGFFCGWGGSWDTPYGRFFLEWYSKALVDHGERLLNAASTVFNFRKHRLGKVGAAALFSAIDFAGLIKLALLHAILIGEGHAEAWWNVPRSRA